MARLTKQAWLAHGLETLRTAGFQALRVLPMTKALGVSRGSFYWHFKDIEDFRGQLIDGWRQLTGALVQNLAAMQTPAEQLSFLIGASANDDLALERQVRAWASADEDVAESVREVDRGRLEALKSILQGAGLDEARALRRAKLLYAASLGQLVADRALLGLKPDDADPLASLLIGRH